MTSTKPGGQVGGYRNEVDQQKLGPALVITAGLILGMRTTRWEATHSDGLAGEEWEKEVEHSARVAATKISESPLYVVLPERSPLNDRAMLTLHDLSGEQWIMFERKAHPDLYDSILRRAAEEAIVFRDGQKVLTAEDAAQLVSENLGIAFLSRSAIERQGASSRSSSGNPSRQPFKAGERVCSSFHEADRTGEEAASEGGSTRS